ncbi:hypothetical protein BH23PAT2_BH23PAT2_08490 [soil metagenome]
MATVKEIAEKAYTRVNGEFELLVEGSDDFKTYLNVLNQCMEGLAHTPYVKWQIFFDMNYTLGTIVDATLSYDIPLGGSNITFGNSPFDYVYFDLAGVVVAKYKVVDVAMFQSTSNAEVCAISGGKLWLKATATKIVGATIRAPAYIDPAPYTTAVQIVTVDSVPWLVHTMAAFVCDASPVPFISRNADKYYKLAEVYMKEMRENNRRTQALMIKTLHSPTAHQWSDVMNVMTIQDL